ncbi:MULTISPECIES: DUF3124 domain-containing protein [unclassified Cellulophaga]|uniref:DUF3124 domain-containing protein n=1 Tax=unclassified Cellulophaga TaxID=2634405 RepID=UPI0026E1DFF7|nr:MULTISPECIES: DUF3124 domain-containing protein [unclassified Cellulophaga]MDO6492169.1 DUF3124 domain-containing protein [Cellulophaga sp. 2_MG-2023]MDO6495670.1 DUF3124 domain-containing protein [Cellulophaga sp. 3_MG-2023]
MKNVVLLLVLVITFGSCTESKETTAASTVNWKKRNVDYKISDSLKSGKTYLSVYSQVYSQSEHTTHDLTATVNMRNTSNTDTLYILNAEYFNTAGKLIRNYNSKPIYVAPMESVAIVIDEHDKEGGTGGNFVFNWKINKLTSKPLFEGVFISTKGQQGLSFVTQGKEL